MRLKELGIFKQVLYVDDAVNMAESREESPSYSKLI